MLTWHHRTEHHAYVASPHRATCLRGITALSNMLTWHQGWAQRAQPISIYSRGRAQMTGAKDAQAILPGGTIKGENAIRRELQLLMYALCFVLESDMNISSYRPDYARLSCSTRKSCTVCQAVYQAHNINGPAIIHEAQKAQTHQRILKHCSLSKSLKQHSGKYPAA